MWVCVTIPTGGTCLRYRPRVGYSGDNGRMGGGRVDFFINHAGADGAWADWLVWRLRALAKNEDQPW